MSEQRAIFRPSIIDVVVLVDAPRILYHYGPNKAKDDVTFSDYQQLGPNGEGVGYVYMVTTWWDAKGEGGSELSVFGKVGNKIHWRMRTLSMGGQADGLSAAGKPVAYQAAIRQFVINHGAEYISTPVKKTDTIDSWNFDPNGNLVHQKVNDVYWEAEVLKAAAPGDQVVYHMPFHVLCNCPECNDNGKGGDDNGTGGGGGGGDPCGGYTHDPFIHTTQQ